MEPVKPICTRFRPINRECLFKIFAVCSLEFVDTCISVDVVVWSHVNCVYDAGEDVSQAKDASVMVV